MIKINFKNLLLLVFAIVACGIFYNIKTTYAQNPGCTTLMATYNNNRDFTIAWTGCVGVLGWAYSGSGQVSDETTETDASGSVSVTVPAEYGYEIKFIATVTGGFAPAMLGVFDIRPNIIVETESISTHTPYPGQSIEIFVTPRNNGNGPSTITTLRYQQSASNLFTSTSERGTDIVDIINGNTTGPQESVSFVAPGTSGRYYYRGCIDVIDGETSTTDNCSSTLIVDVIPAADLTVTNLSLSRSKILAGDPFTFFAAVENTGGQVSPSTTLTYYRSTDNAINPLLDTNVGTDAVPILGSPGRSFQYIELTSQSITGTYYYGACVTKVSNEKNVNNNCSSAIVLNVINPPPPPENIMFPECSDDIVFADWDSSPYKYEDIFRRHKYEYIFTLPSNAVTTGNTFFSNASIRNTYTAGQIAVFTVNVSYRDGDYTIQSSNASSSCTVPISDILTQTPAVVQPPVITGLHFDFCNDTVVAADWNSSALTYLGLTNRIYEYEWQVDIPEDEDVDIISGISSVSSASIVGIYLDGDMAHFSVLVRYGNSGNYVRSNSVSATCTVNSFSGEVATPTFGMQSLTTVTPDCSNDTNLCIAPQISTVIYDGTWYNNLPTPRIN